MDRRHFLRAAAGAGVFIPSFFGSGLLRAFAQGPAGAPFQRLASAPSDRILVILRLMGGNDGLNTVVPYHNDLYYEARGRGRSVEVSIPADTVVPLQDHPTLGFHPKLAPIAELYHEGKVAIIENIGYTSQNLSHYRSTDIWLTGSDPDVFTNAGWYGRFLEEQHPEYPEILPVDPFAIELGLGMSSTIHGNRAPMGIALEEIEYIPDVPFAGDSSFGEAELQVARVRETIRQSSLFSQSISESLQRVPSTPGTYDLVQPMQRHMSTIARLISAGVGTALYIVNIDNYDFHSNQLVRQQGMHNYFASAVYNFQRDLEAMGLDDRVTMMTISEFGRRVESAGEGTDHGGASVMFAIGSTVKGGVIGRDPDLVNLDEIGNLRHEFDFRQMYATMLYDWFEAPPADVVPAVLPRNFTTLPIFHTLSGVERDGEVSLSLQVAPNPASGRTTASFTALQSTGGTLTLHTAEGRTVLSAPLYRGSTSCDLDLRGVPPGVYICELRSGRAVGTQALRVVR